MISKEQAQQLRELADERDAASEMRYLCLKEYVRIAVFRHEVTRDRFDALLDSLTEPEDE